PLSPDPFEFPALNKQTFKGLPGMLADSLPDTFGNALIDAWLAAQGRVPDSFTPVERLCYTGSRGMGALEFKPSLDWVDDDVQVVEVESLVELATRVLDDRVQLAGKLSGRDDQQAISQILRVGTSAGGARAKAVLAWHPQTQEFRSGQLDAAPGFEHWLLKFDGVANNRDKELADPAGFGRIEYAYALMAQAAGISMAPCRLHEEGGRAHFMTQRFDRDETGARQHMQSLGALLHLDFNLAGAYGYEQALQLIRTLGLPREDLEQQILRAFFNVVARNQDDHVKNIAFVMNRRGDWRLSPAFDVTYAYNPHGQWTAQHQMSIGGKRRGFVVDDLYALAAAFDVKKHRARRMLEAVSAAVGDWLRFADEAGITEVQAQRVAAAHRSALWV
ncbi:MAG: type II toxin-antitoxin system HipA family toxin, partial [Pseudomonadota bacterium]